MKKMILCCLVAVLGCGVFAVEAKTPQKKGEIVTRCSRSISIAKAVRPAL
mgnify:CR=1 FL=1